MIKINNVPCEYIDKFPTKIEFILLHKLIDNEKYKNYYIKNKNNGKYKILDNSTYELGKSLEGDLLIKWAKKINAVEIIIPDSYANKEETIRLMNDFFKKHSNCEYRLMGVPQGKNQKELIDCFEIMKRDSRIDVIGINKLWNRKQLQHSINDCDKEIHLLGLNNMKEWDYDYGELDIRSGDSRRLAQKIIGVENIWEEKMTENQQEILKRLIEEY